MKFPQITLGSSIISPHGRPYVIAEIGVNHEGSLARAKKMIKLAKEGGADAAKFQSYKAEQLAMVDSPAYWNLDKEPTSTQYELFKKYDSFGEDDYRALAEYCNELAIDFVSTPFDPVWVSFLDPLVPFFKVASADINNLPLLRAVAQTGKPTVLSTGASSLEEIRWAVELLQKEGSSAVALLHCVLSYPTRDEDAHLAMISGLVREFGELVIGYSDHTVARSGLPSLVSAWLLGASILEKHFTDEKTASGNDHYHAMDYQDLSEFRALVEQTQKSLGSSEERSLLECETISRVQARRSIVAAVSLKAGSVLTAESMSVKRPGTGLSPVMWDSVIGKIVLKDIAEGEQILLRDIQ